MDLSRKQKIYLEMLRWGIVSCRNNLTNATSIPWWQITFWRRHRLTKTAHEIAQLLHELPMLILQPDFDDGDLWFLNVHSHCFVQDKTGAVGPIYSLLCKHIQELFALVPDNLRTKLQWEGPKLPSIEREN